MFVLGPYPTERYVWIVVYSRWGCGVGFLMAEVGGFFLPCGLVIVSECGVGESLVVLCCVVESWSIKYLVFNRFIHIRLLVMRGSVCL